MLKTTLPQWSPPILKYNMFVTDIKEKCTMFNQYFKEQCKTIVSSSILPSQVNKVITGSSEFYRITNFETHPIFRYKQRPRPW